MSFGLFCNYRLITCSERHLEYKSHSYIVSLLYKSKATAKVTNDLSIGFGRDRGRRKRELTNNKNQNNKYDVRFMLKDIFGFSQHQEKATYRLGYNLTLTQNNESAVLNKDNATNGGRIKLLLLNAMYHNIHPVFHNKLYYLNRFYVRYLQNFNMWK